MEKPRAVLDPVQAILESAKILVLNAASDVLFLCKPTKWPSVGRLTRTLCGTRSSSRGQNVLVRPSPGVLLRWSRARVFLLTVDFKSSDKVK